MPLGFVFQPRGLSFSVARQITEIALPFRLIISPLWR
jgi:hypothetical protein